eukprot:TRINITY_DN16995_c0_g1_i1.p1 TRINITY_DN16995_c0_g1~~TRINITY_DN16995_c0_g1_i1.p1  ORF type:complete len:948 (+),score=186.63 TRINITY_DN16995_c0_g1_i1:57-2900(+)
MLSFKSEITPGTKLTLPPEGQETPAQQHIVGTERDGVVLVARNDWDGKVYKSYIDVLEKGKSSVRFKQDTKHAAKDGPLKLCAASLNTDKSILACTVRRERATQDPSAPPISEYECWLMGRGNSYFSLKNPEGSRQQFPRVQFLNFESSKSSKCLYIYTLDKETIEIYSLHQDKKKGLVGQSGKIYSVAEQHLWSQFMPHNNTLYVLFLKQRREGGTGSTLFGADVVLKCFSFRPGDRPETIMEVNLSMKFSEKVLRSPTVYQDRPWAGGHAPPDKHLRIQMVTQYDRRRTGRGTEDKQIMAVLVHQHDSLPGDSAIRMGLYCLMTKHCISLSISPSPSLPPLSPLTSVFVGPLRRGILAVYLPGYFLYLLDIQHRSRPSRLLVGCASPDVTVMCISGRVPVTPPPPPPAPPEVRYDSGDSSSVNTTPSVATTTSPSSSVRIDTDCREGSPSPITFSPAGSPKRAWPSHHEDQAVRQLVFMHHTTGQASLILDNSTCTFYSYDLEEQALRDWTIHSAPSDALPPIMHYNLGHLRDMSSIRFNPLDMIIGVTKERPGTLTSELFKEYFVGTTHQKVKEHYKGKDVSDMLDLMPRTTLVSSVSKLRMAGTGCRITITRLPGAGSSGGERLVMLPVKMDCREDDDDTPVPAPHETESGFFHGLRDRLSISGFSSSSQMMQTVHAAPDVGDKTYASVTANAFKEGVLKQFYKGGATPENPQLWAAIPKHRAVPFVRRYAEIASNILDKLLNEMMKYLNVRDSDAFSALLALSVTLEELSFPKTTQLNRLLINSAYHTCTRRQFLQVLRSGGIYLDADLVAEIRSLEATDPKRDPLPFLYLEATLLSKEDRVKSLMGHHGDVCNTHFLQYHYKESCSTKPARDSDEAGKQQGKEAGEEAVTNFWPFEILRKNWNASSKTKSKEYLESHAPQYMEKTLNPLVTLRSLPGQNEK